MVKVGGMRGRRGKGYGGPFEVDGRQPDSLGKEKVVYEPLLFFSFLDSEQDRRFALLVLGCGGKGVG